MVVRLNHGAVENGYLTGSWRTVLDITDRKRAEEALREHEGMIRALVEKPRDWIWAIDLQGNHTYCNPAIESILGYRPDELVGKPSLDLIHEEDRKTQTHRGGAAR